ncbi:MAG TPA: hypothetical protein H9968_03005 [Candidatus Anaerobutyricum stercoris]|uniref:Uncharacterized protein n=1 Tax=Candidatus Anaerobutyricum stercoris TaxID=2838457 RepID=A0A9D2EJY0_9FIRM|nr:hypothetical protein [Candidatus Anaerobutyricum stercoris]
MLMKVTFESMEELKDFAKMILSGEDGTISKTEGKKTTADVVSAVPAPQVPVQQEVPVQSAPTQAIAPVAAPSTSAAQESAPPRAQQPIQTTVPTAQPSYTMEDLSKAGMTLMDSGRQGELRNLLAQFGVQSLPDLPKEQYGAFATALRGLGAQI